MGIEAAFNRRISSEYQPSDIDTAADTKYYGYLAADGSWYIMEEVTTAGTFRYYRANKDSIGYATAWAARAGYTYVLFSALF